MGRLYFRYPLSMHGLYHDSSHGELRWLRQVTRKIDSADKMDWTRESEFSGCERTRLVIIGAGIAGLAAARTLEDSNFSDYILLEAQDAIGGRISSIRWNDNWIEAGAQFLHGDRSTLGKFAKQHDLLSNEESSEGEGIFLRSDGSPIDQCLVSEIDDLVCDALEDCEKYAFSDDEPINSENIGKLLRGRMTKYLRAKNESSAIARILEEIFDWIVRFLVIDNSCFTLDELSTKFWGKFRFVGGPEHLVFKNGYSSLTKLLSEKIGGKKLRLNSPVETIDWRNHGSIEKNNIDPIVLTLSDKSRISTDCVIITSSLGYLKENHRRMFSPELPIGHVRAIESLGFGLINKIFLDFGEPWWEAGTKGIQLVWRKKNDFRIDNENDDEFSSWIYDLTGFDVLENQKGILLGWVGGRGAFLVEKLSENEIADNCLEALKKFSNRDNIPAVKRCRRTRWNANKFVRGAYSHIPTCCDRSKTSPAALAEPVWRTNGNRNNRKPVPVLMFAGEATHENFYSTTHGAYDTGRTQASIFLRHHVTE